MVYACCIPLVSMPRCVPLVVLFLMIHEDIITIMKECLLLCVCVKACPLPKYLVHAYLYEEEFSIELLIAVYRLNLEISMRFECFAPTCNKLNRDVPCFYLFAPPRLCYQ